MYFLFLLFIEILKKTRQQKKRKNNPKTDRIYSHSTSSNSITNFTGFGLETWIYKFLVEINKKVTTKQAPLNKYSIIYLIYL